MQKACKDLQILKQENVKLQSDKDTAVAQAQGWRFIALQHAAEKRDAITDGEHWQAKSREWEANAHMFMLKWLSKSQKPDLPEHVKWMDASEPDLSPQMPWMRPDAPPKPTQPAHPPPPELLVRRRFSNSKSPIRRIPFLRLKMVKCKVKA